MKLRARTILGLFSFIVLASAGAGCSDGGELTIRSVEPQSGRLQGDEKVTIRGKNFRTDLGYTVYFGPNRARRVAVQDPKTLIAFTPRASEEGIVDLAVRGDDGVTLMVRGGFTYESGKTESSSPAAGHSESGETGSSLVY